ncbi:MAG: CoA pyrophosphatase [Deltaproteobacteria bacterium]|nr:CoA pyrophosphatase [Deltaproteobacteria bacterium]
MRNCQEDFVDQIRKLLSSRQRKVIQNPSLANAAVLVPLFNKGGNCHILFTKRTDLVKYHKGEISFPGGMLDEDDRSLERTALREAFEEVGLKEEDVQLIGALDDIVTITQFIVTPFIGLFRYPYPFKTSPVEIAELIEVPLSFLLNKENFAEYEITRMGRKDVVYAYRYGEHTIWGATARILKQFLEVIGAFQK